MNVCPCQSTAAHFSLFGYKMHTDCYIQLSVSQVVPCISITVELGNLDTNGAEETVIFSEVSLFQRLKCMQVFLERCPYSSEVSLYEGSTV